MATTPRNNDKCQKEQKTNEDKGTAGTKIKQINDIATTPENETSKHEEKSSKDNPPRLRRPRTAAFAFYCHYQSQQHTETIGPFSIYLTKDANSLIFSFPTVEFVEKVGTDFRQLRDHHIGLKARSQHWKQHLSYHPDKRKGFFVEKIRPEFVWRKREIEHLRKVVGEAKGAVEMKLQEWVEAERMIEGALGHLQGALGAIDALPEDGEGGEGGA